MKRAPVPPASPSLVVERLYAYIIVTADHTEALPIIVDDAGALLPLVGADLTRMQDLRPHAQAFANTSGRPVTLYCFAPRVAVETLAPEEEPTP